ncbi:MAG: hypothetical protein QNK24_09035, partial [Desulfuromusa sp.]|nr:hypothetical protein [Desulfuromusa sp.]
MKYRSIPPPCSCHNHCSAPAQNRGPVHHTSGIPAVPPPHVAAPHALPFGRKPESSPDSPAAPGAAPPVPAPFNINHEQNGIAALSDSAEHLNNLTQFKKTFHRLIAEGINRHLGREGAVFSTPARTVECLDNESVEQQFFYAMTNPVKDDLVDRIAHWKGFSSYDQLALGKDNVY